MALKILTASSLSRNKCSVSLNNPKKMPLSLLDLLFPTKMVPVKTFDMIHYPDRKYSLARTPYCHKSPFTFIRLDIESVYVRELQTQWWTIDVLAPCPNKQYAHYTSPLGLMYYCKVPRHVPQVSNKNNDTALLGSSGSGWIDNSLTD